MLKKPVKLTVPYLYKVYPRTRLFEKLDATRSHPLVWIAAPGGAGKTTLVASYLQARNIEPLWYQIDQGDNDIASFFYHLGEGLKLFNRSRKRILPLLTPEYQLGLETFSRNFFRNLFNNIKTPSTVVLDNFEFVNENTNFNEILQQGLEEIPLGCQVIITGRVLPPAQYASMISKEQLVQMGWNELKVTEEESSAIIKLLSEQHDKSNQFIQRIHKKAHGWISGLVLLYNQISSITDNSELEAFIDSEPTGEDSLDLFFNYFTNEILNRLPDETRMFLLKTAWLNNIRPSNAKKLTGISSAKNILKHLEQHQMFTVRRGLIRPIYSFHPLFKIFLQNQAEETYSESEINELKNKTANILLDEKELDEAAMLYIQSQNWLSLERLIQDNAQKLLDQGRHKLLKLWLDRIPASNFNRNPWLQYWRGCTELMFEPLLAQNYFKNAFQLFNATEDVLGTYLGWLGVMDSIFFSNDTYEEVPKWINELDQLRTKYPRYPNLEIKGRITFSAYHLQLMGCPQSPSFNDWRKKAERLQRFIPDASIRCLTGSQLAMYYTFYEQQHKLKVLANSLYKLTHSKKLVPVAYIMACWVEITKRWQTGEKVESESVINDAINLSENSGVYVVHVWLMSAVIMYYLAKNKSSKAENYLDKFHNYVNTTHRSEQGFYHYLAAWIAYNNQDLELAYEHIESTMKYMQQLHSPFLECLNRSAYSFILIEKQMYNEAQQQIDQTKYLARQIENDNLGIYYNGLMQAWLLYRQGKTEQIQPHLREALTCARKMELVAVPWHLPNMLATLCAIALENNIETNYVQTLVRKNNLQIPKEAYHIINWPMPIRIYTLGRFSLLINDKNKVQFDKSNSKPLLLLKALIAFGGREVSDSKLEEALWPDAEGDAAHRALITNLQRLRKLLGIHEAIIHSENKLTLNPSYCWIDIWAFERGLSASKIEQLASVLSLYKGNFLENELDVSWLLSTRERLRRKYLQAVNKLAQLKISNSQWQEAIELYYKGLEIDALHESFYQELMLAHQQLGQTSEVKQVYMLCQRKLQNELGVKPSTKTKVLYDSLSSD